MHSCIIFSCDTNFEDPLLATFKYGIPYFFFFKDLGIYLMAVLSLIAAHRLFPAVASGSCSLVSVPGLLSAVASRCRAWAQ